MALNFLLLFPPRYVWFFIGWYKDDWFMNQAYLTEDQIECTKEQMIEAAEGHFTTEALMWNQNKKEQTASGITVAEVRSDSLHLVPCPPV